MNKLVLCLITIREAQHLGHAAQLAGGWVATSPICRHAVEDVTERPLLLALLPSDWSEARQFSARETHERLAAWLEARAAWGIEESTAADFAGRIRAHLVSVAVDQAAYAPRAIGGAS